MKTVFVKEGSSKSYTNLITSSAADPPSFEKKKNLSREPIGQQQLPLGINNVETQMTHRRAKLQLLVLWVCGDGIWVVSFWSNN